MNRLLYSEPLLFETGDRMSLDEFLDRWERMPELKNAELIDGIVYTPWPVIPDYPLLFEPGDRMSLDEFLDRWERMPELKRAELIDGVVYMPSPVSIAHGTNDGLFHIVLGVYAAKTLGCRFTPDTTWLMKGSAPQPDAAMHIIPEYGGRAGMRGELASGSPELIVEVAVSSHARDLGPKLDLYQRSGVPEYVALLIEEERIEWRVLDQGSYRLMQPDSGGIFRSQIFPGLWLDSAAFWKQDGARLLSVLEEGLASEEHSKFVEAHQFVMDPSGRK